MAKKSKAEATQKETKMSNDYDDILNRSWDEIPEDKLTPNGSWVLKVRNAAFIEPKEEGKSARVVFFYTPKEPLDDVDAVALQELEAEGYDLSQNQITAQFYVEGNRDWNTIRGHMDKHIGGKNGDAKNIRESLKLIKGAEVVAYVDVRSYDKDVNGETVTITENSATNFTKLA